MNFPKEIKLSNGLFMIRGQNFFSVAENLGSQLFWKLVRSWTLQSGSSQLIQIADYVKAFLA